MQPAGKERVNQIPENSAHMTQNQSRQIQIGLAVGDIAEVQRNAALKRIAMQSMFSYFLSCEDFRVEAPSNDATMEVELWKQKNRLKDLSTAMQKQHELIKLIIQKMEIVSEADDEDQRDSSPHNKPNKQKMERKESKWDCVYFRRVM
ncbi:unnamed protein product [Ranitomeya imitator]|uniref:Uncharacterized protein n=1 Tax=Ranitomeya imitator TaxID=111125 RepID=A0ABN9L0I2_9NEOB|nr:unnamed protein product [Ranitomeya imitator]